MRTKTKNIDVGVPLAARIRPKRLEDFVGQEEVLGEGTALRRAIERGVAGSLILWGPPGVGKTTLAYIIADRMEAKLERVSAVTAGVRGLRDIISRAALRQAQGKRTVLIVDEIHRFNKAQQDVLLPSVEEGLVTLIGATTENPYFEVIKALVSRAEVVWLEGLKTKDIRRIVRRALSLTGASLSKEGEEVLVKIAGGDARRALNILERAFFAKATKAKAGRRTINLVDIESAAQQSVVQYDKKGDAHYDVISAFIKSMRSSDPDAALFYLFRMVMAGEDPKFIVRRMIIFASEDIGNADPHALMLANSVAQAVERVGLPEAEFALAQAATYLAAAPKSNSVYKAKEAAKEDVRNHSNAMPPGHITNKGVGHVVAQRYRPDEVQNNIYYRPGEEGFEKEVKRRVEAARKLLH